MYWVVSTKSNTKRIINIEKEPFLFLNKKPIGIKNEIFIAVIIIDWESSLKLWMNANGLRFTPLKPTVLAKSPNARTTK